jgi:hypothetical protein
MLGGVKPVALHVLLEVAIGSPRTRLGRASGLDYGAPMESQGRPEELVGLPVPDLRLATTRGTAFALRSRVGRGPLVLFFYIHNGTPG